MVQGREEDGRSMPVSLVFSLVNCDVDRFLDYLEANPQGYQATLEKAFEEGYAIAAWYSFDRTTIPGVLNVNNGALRQVGNIDGAHPHDLTVAERAGIQVALDRPPGTYPSSTRPRRLSPDACRCQCRCAETPADWSASRY